MARKKINEIIEIPKEIDVQISGDSIKFTKQEKEINVRIFYDLQKQDNKIILKNDNPTKRDKKIIKTMVALIRNAISGLQENYTYTLKICSIHFPMNVAVQENQVIIKNFLGESIPRKANILQDVEVKIDKDIIKVSSPDKNKAGQTAANVEEATKINNRDRRVFQDGIFITQKQKGVKRQ